MLGQKPHRKGRRMGDQKTHWLINFPGKDRSLFIGIVHCTTPNVQEVTGRIQIELVDRHLNSNPFGNVELLITFINNIRIRLRIPRRYKFNLLGMLLLISRKLGLQSLSVRYVVNLRRLDQLHRVVVQQLLIRLFHQVILPRIFHNVLIVIINHTLNRPDNHTIAIPHSQRRQRIFPHQHHGHILHRVVLPFGNLRHLERVIVIIVVVILRVPIHGLLRVHPGRTVDVVIDQGRCHRFGDHGFVLVTATFVQLAADDRHQCD
uniref:(northern house mosquito) hypothetical protein n=1 Tax=Culex pipiens TaxID=7175 RepID=A0A8D8G3Y1_CULPI